MTRHIGPLLLLLGACGGDGNKDEDAFEGLYDPCTEPADCDGRVPDEVEGVCIDGDSDGFCSWRCTADADCGEAFDEDFDYVCASFEEEPDQYCFPSCREDDPDVEEDDVCPPGYECRSTGGGVENRRVCFPVDEGETTPTDTGQAR